MLGTGMEAAGSVPVGTMMWNSLVMALTIAVGKIAISNIVAGFGSTADNGRTAAAGAHRRPAD